MIVPDSFYKQIWNHFIIYIILIVSAIYVPIVICFFQQISKAQEMSNLFIDFCFAVDIGVNLSTAYYEKGKLIDDKRLIWKRYLTTWFMLDFFTMLPYQQLYLFEKDQNYSLADI